MRGKRPSVKILLTVLAIAGILTSCGSTQNLRDVSVDDTAAVTNEITEMFDPAEFVELYGISSDLYQGAQLSPLAMTAPQNQDPGRVLVFLNPNKIRRRGYLLRAIEAPLHVAWFFGGLMRVGDTSCFADVTGWNTCPQQIRDTGECTISYTTTATGCSRPVYMSQMSFTVTISGQLDVTVKAIQGGFEVTASPSDLKIEGADGRYLIYNGSVTKSVVFDSDRLGHTSTLRTTNLTVVDSAGATGTVSGTRTLEVRYGESFSAHSTGVLTYTPPEGGETIVIEIDLQRNVNISENSKTISISDRVITNGVERTRTVNVEIEREVNEGGVLKEITISGDATFSGPGGTLAVTVDKLVIDVNCPHNPSGGRIVIEGRNHTIEVIFSENCSCNMQVIVDGGGDPQNVDACAWNEFRRNMGGGGTMK